MQGAGHSGYPVALDGYGRYLFIGTTGSKTNFAGGADSPCWGARVYSARIR